VVDLSPTEPDLAPPEDDRPARSSVTAPKARPTPKRSEAQANRRAPYQAPADRKAAYRDSKDRNRGERARRSQAYQRGEQWALPPKDRGSVRALARDVVDARRGLSEYYLFAAIPVVALIFLPQSGLKLIADVLVLLILIVVVGEGYLVGRKVMRLAEERYPGESVRGVRVYAAIRATQMRKMRIPKPRVNRGDPV
jgi:Protein of unknown function (DUF3043)